MLIFEKYIDQELNMFSSIYLILKLKYNTQYRRKFEQYKAVSNNLKQMFQIHEAEKELKEDNSLKDFEFLLNRYTNNFNVDPAINGYLDNAFSN